MQGEGCYGVISVHCLGCGYQRYLVRGVSAHKVRWAHPPWSTLAPVIFALHDLRTLYIVNYGTHPNNPLHRTACRAGNWSWGLIWRLHSAPCAAWHGSTSNRFPAQADSTIFPASLAWWSTIIFWLFSIYISLCLAFRCNDRQPP